MPVGCRDPVYNSAAKVGLDRMTSWVVLRHLGNGHQASIFEFKKLTQFSHLGGSFVV